MSRTNLAELGAARGPPPISHLGIKVRGECTTEPPWEWSQNTNGCIARQTHRRAIRAVQHRRMQNMLILSIYYACLLLAARVAGVLRPTCRGRSARWLCCGSSSCGRLCCGSCRRLLRLLCRGPANAPRLDSPSFSA
eukprot:2829529-Alexandrium_andersonii.AAC.1